MTDNGLAALATTLVEIDVKSIDDWWTWEPTKLAAAILGPRGVFLPDGDCGHVEGRYESLYRSSQTAIEMLRRDNRLQQTEIATLRAENNRLQESFLRQRDCDHSDCIDEADTLRAALDGLRPLAKSGASRAHLMESGVMVRHNGTLWECEAERCIAARELAWTPEERAAKSAALAAAKETP
jgi:hypothetical protein